MSEVLPGSGAEQAAGRASLPPDDERQSLRVRRFLMAAGTSLLACVALVAWAALGLVPWRVAFEGTVGILALVLAFYLVFRTRLNLRFADPSLTTEQVATAILFLAYLVYRGGPQAEALTLFYPVAMLFGVLRLNVARLMALALLALAAHATVLYVFASREQGMPLETALAEFAVLAVVLPWFAVMGGYVNRLRVRLSDSNRDLMRAYERIERVAIRDPLTGAFNRRFLMEALERERARAARRGDPFAVCIMDLDHFKAVNDSLGHAAGDALLRRVAQLVPQELRAVDFFGRFGGEEFLLIISGSGAEGAKVCAERVRARIEALAVPELGDRRVTATLGVAAYARGESIATLLSRADAALYDGKARGRNQVVAMG